MKSYDTFIDSACIRLGSVEGFDHRLTPDHIQSAWNAARDSIHLASVLGHTEAIQSLLGNNPSLAKQQGGLRVWDPLTYLCFSHFLRQPLEGSDFVSAAKCLLHAGANPNTGFFHDQHSPKPIFESVLYAAAGIAHHEALTRLLLEHGADPNDGEPPYHVPEGYENGAFEAVFQSGKLNASGIATLLLRKIDFHDGRAIKWLLEQGVDPNLKGIWGKTALQSAIIRGNHLSIIQCLLEFGADPNMSGKDGNAHALAARYGRGDVIKVLKSLGTIPERTASEQILAACATGDEELAQSLVKEHPKGLDEIIKHDGFFLCEFASNGNTDGIRLLLNLGCHINATHQYGDAYYDITKGSTALHVAAWRAQHDTVGYLSKTGADVHQLDSKHRSALQLAVEASINSYWTELRSDRSVQALIQAGATRDGVRFPCGYDKIDTLLATLV